MTEATPISTEDSLRVIRHIATTNQVSLPWNELRQILETRLTSILESKVLTEVIPSRVPATITTVNYEPTDPSSSPLSSPTFSFDDPSANVDDENELEKQHILTQIQHDLGEAAKQNDADENDDDEDDEDDDDEEEEVAVEGEKKQDKEQQQQQQQQEQQEVDKSTSHQQERISTEAHGTAENKEYQESTSVAASETSAAASESQTMDADNTRDAKENEADEKKVTDQENKESSPSSSATMQDQQRQDGSPVNIEAAAAQAADSQPRLASRDLPAYETPAAYHKRICELLAAFSSPPFTIQRICELLLDPTAHHTLVTKYLRAVEKVLNITSSIDEFSNPSYIGVSALDAKEGGQAEFTLNGGYSTTMQSDDTSIETAMPTTTEAITSSATAAAAAAATGSPEESRTVPTMAQDNKMETSGETDNNANANAVPATTSMEQEGNMAMDVDPPADGSAANGAPVRSPIEGSDSENATTMMDVDP
ncbi:hypothetical protein BGW42_007429 [Actinomortierella wolfii]|nr:hypothetical protein BGW42_007429 [Actinomortierella wolfii]